MLNILLLYQISVEKFPIVQHYVSKKFAPFKNLANFDKDGKLVLKELKALKKSASENKIYYDDSRFLNSGDQNTIN